MTLTGMAARAGEGSRAPKPGPVSPGSAAVPARLIFGHQALESVPFGRVDGSSLPLEASLRPRCEVRPLATAGHALRATGPRRRIGSGRSGKPELHTGAAGIGGLLVVLFVLMLFASTAEARPPLGDNSSAGGSVAAGLGQVSNERAISGLGARAFGYLASYVDVSDRSVHYPAIQALSDLGIFEGTSCGTDRFCSGEDIDRKTMAVWVVRVIDGTDPPSGRLSGFVDVDGVGTLSFYAPFIERMRELRITEGCDDGSKFCPNDGVSRAHMAVFFARAFKLRMAGEPEFTDIRHSDWFSDEVASLAASGITEGCGADRFCPGTLTTRGQMATFLFRASSSFEANDELPLPEPESLSDVRLGSDLGKGPGAVRVHYCGPEDSYTGEDLKEEVAQLNDKVKKLFDIESSYRTEISFQVGSVISPDRINWNGPRTEDWRRCAVEAGETPDERKVLIIFGGSGLLRDEQGNEVLGVGWIGGGPALTSSEALHRDKDDYLHTVAHEVGHAFYSLRHPWWMQPQQICLFIKNSGGKNLDRYVTNSEYIGPGMWHNYTCIDELAKLDSRQSSKLSQEGIDDWLKSVMSYPGIVGSYGAVANFDLDGVGPPARTYVACKHKVFLDWPNSDACEFLVSVPDAPPGPVLTAGFEEFTVVWTAPNNRGSEVIAYDVEYRRTGTNTWIRWHHEGVSRNTTIAGLRHATEYQVRVRAWNSEGTGQWSRYSTGRTLNADVTPRTVTLTLGDPVGDSNSSYWLHVTLEGFRPGSYSLTCAHLGIPEEGIGPGVFGQVDGISAWPANRACSLPTYRRGVEVYVIVDAVSHNGRWEGGTYSNVVIWPTVPPDTPPAEGVLVNDDPYLGDEIAPYTWWKPPADIDVLGYGDNGFHFTLAQGNSNTLDNWAAWEFPPVTGRYEIHAWIPEDWATADAQYRIYVDANRDGNFHPNEKVDEPELDQQDVNGWQSLGTYDIDGGVRIEVRDTETGDDWTVVRAPYARLAVDAMRLTPLDASPPTSGSGGNTLSNTAMSAGRWFHSCGIRSDGTAVCWGDNEYGRANAPPGTFTAISAGNVRTCGIRSDGTVVCWGESSWRHDAPSGTFAAISTNIDDSCGIRSDGTAVCWGANFYQQADVPSGMFTAISAGSQHVCAIRSDGTAVCWGYNEDGRADVPSGMFTAISAGSDHSCGIRSDGTVVCWGGANEYGQADEPAGTFTAISGSGSHSCGIRSDGAAVCWGLNDSGQLDAPSGTFAAISAGSGHSCGIRRDGTAVCWGNNEFGQLDVPSDGFQIYTNIPDDVST